MRPEHIFLLTALGHWSAASGSLPPARLEARDKPALPDREPFGFGAAATGGGVAHENNTYLVNNMMDLRTVLKMDEPRTVYVQGEIQGNQINETFSGDCQYYIDSSSVPGFNFTLYVMALNATYTDAVKAAVAANQTFEGRNATEYLQLLNHQNVCLSLSFSLFLNRDGRRDSVHCISRHRREAVLLTSVVTPGMARPSTKRAEIVGVHRRPRELDSDRNGREYPYIYT